MKSIFKLTSLIAIAAILSLTCCKDEETGPAPDTRTKTQLMIASPWKWTASACDVEIDVDGKDGASKDIYGQYPACFKDDLYTFKADSTTTEASNVKCTTEAASYKNTWIFTNGEKNLLWKGKDFKTRQYLARDYTILELTFDKLVLKYNETAGTTVYVITNTYNH
jgi:hypothetical protein